MHSRTLSSRRNRKTLDCLLVGGNDKCTYVGLFDGYIGQAASSLCREHLHLAVQYEMAGLIESIQSVESEEALINRLYARMIQPSEGIPRRDMGDVYRWAYSKMDYLLSRGIQETSSVRWSGTSAFTAVFLLNDRLEQLAIDVQEQGADVKPIVLGHIHVANCGKRDRGL